MSLWTYSPYRAMLFRDGKNFALVTPDGCEALSPADAAELLGVLNAGNPPQEEHSTTAGAVAAAGVIIDSLKERSDRESHKPRLDYVSHLFQLTAAVRSQMLRVEAATELQALFDVAIDAQHFEVAAEIRNEQKRRANEVAVSAE